MCICGGQHLYISTLPHCAVQSFFDTLLTKEWAQARVFLPTPGACRLDTFIVGHAPATLWPASQWSLCTIPSVSGSSDSTEHHPQAHFSFNGADNAGEHPRSYLSSLSASHPEFFSNINISNTNISQTAWCIWIADTNVNPAVLFCFCSVWKM